VKDSDLSYRINALAVSRWTGPDSVTRLRQNVMAPSFLAGLDLKAVAVHLPPHVVSIALAEASQQPSLDPIGIPNGAAYNPTPHGHSSTFSTRGCARLEPSLLPTPRRNSTSSCGPPHNHASFPVW
jgi:hypothetical protein